MAHCGRPAGWNELDLHPAARHTERVLQQRIKQQDEQLSQARARQGQEIATLRDHELPRLQGEVERAFHLAQELEAKQEDIRHRLAQLEQQVKKMDADHATRYAWIQKSFDTQDAKVAAKLNELSRAMETVVAGMKKDIVEAVLYCKAAGVEAYQGGTCNETDLSARACVHLAMASRPERMLAKPGLGFDEGFCIVTHEMARICSTFELRGHHA